MRANRLLIVLLVAGAVAWLALPAAAEIYHVTLTNGAAYESPYPPEEASWDNDLLLIISEAGNWIGVARAEIDTVRIETEMRGFGERINSTTVFMGLAPNANPDPSENEPQDPQLALLEAIYTRELAQESYTIPQFVEPNSIGGGIPLGFTTQTTAPLGVAPQNPGPQQ